MAQPLKTPLENLIMGNIQGLYPRTNQRKMQFLKELTLEEDTVFIALKDTHSKSGVIDAEISIDNCTPFKVDRESRSQGGGMIYVRNDLS